MKHERDGNQGRDTGSGSVLVVWDAFPWMVGLMWDADPFLWATVGKTEMACSERVWPELRDEFFGWLPGRCRG